MNDTPLPGLEPDESAPGDAESAENVPEGVLQHRRPGWALLGPSDGLWHRVASRSRHGLLNAVCGRHGRYLPDARHEIMCCPACAANDPMS